MTRKKGTDSRKTTDFSNVRKRKEQGKTEVTFYGAKTYHGERVLVSDNSCARRCAQKLNQRCRQHKIPLPNPGVGFCRPSLRRAEKKTAGFSKTRLSKKAKKRAQKIQKKIYQENSRRREATNLEDESEQPHPKEPQTSEEIDAMKIEKDKVDVICYETENKILPGRLAAFEEISETPFQASEVILEAPVSTEPAVEADMPIENEKSFDKEGPEADPEQAQLDKESHCESKEQKHDASFEEEEDEVLSEESENETELLLRSLQSPHGWQGRDFLYVLRARTQIFINPPPKKQTPGPRNKRLADFVNRVSGRR